MFLREEEGSEYVQGCGGALTALGPWTPEVHACSLQLGCFLRMILL